MKRLVTALPFLLILCAVAFAQEIDVTRLQKIGDAVSFVRTERGITLMLRVADCGTPKHFRLANHWAFGKRRKFEAPQWAEFIQKIYAPSLKPES